MVMVSEHDFGVDVVQLVVHGTIATYFGNLAPSCGCLHAVVHELCVRAPIGAIVI